MKIFYDHQIFAWQEYGGISRYFYELICRMARVAEVYFYDTFYINKYGLEKNDELSKVFAYHKSKYHGDIDHLRKLVRRCLRNFAWRHPADLYHPTYYGNFTESFPSTPVVVTVYDMIHELFPNNFSAGSSTSKNKMKLIEKADGIIAISQNTKNDVVRIFGVDPDKVKVIYLANSLQSNPGSIPSLNYPYILYVGSREAGYKNFSSLLEAYAKSHIKKRINLVAFGGGPFSEKEKGMINKLNIDGKVYQVSGDDSTLANIYKYATAMAYPSLYEGFGIPPLEAMYYGTPVITSKVSSIPEVVGDAALYFNPFDIDDMREKIENIVENSDLQAELKKRGYLQEKIFSWDKCAKETFDFYSEIVNR